MICILDGRDCVCVYECVCGVMAGADVIRFELLSLFFE